jgi:SAM-dependent methyltransferase
MSATPPPAGPASSPSGAASAGSGTAARRWSELLEARRIPEAILAAAPANPFHQDPERFLPPVEPPDTPARRAGLDLLGDTHTRQVLDVGCGAGAASLALRPLVSRITGVDDAADMLAMFAKTCLEAGVPYDAVLGTWPGAAGAAEGADVVVCRNVAYDAPDLAAFVRALSAAARTGVVLELHARHPQTWLDPLWRRFHDLDRPTPATADDAVAVLTELGVEPTVERWRPATSAAARAAAADPMADARRVCRRLCLPEDRADEVAAVLAEVDTGPEERVAVSWRTG